MPRPDRSQLLERILERAGAREDGTRTLDCAQAFALAEAHDLELMDIARVCNQEKIKIARCQLGCFR